MARLQQSAIANCGGPADNESSTAVMSLMGLGPLSGISPDLRPGDFRRVAR
jgi:hypothetical protein